MKKSLKKFGVLGAFRWALSALYGIVVLQKQSKGSRPKESKMEKKISKVTEKKLLEIAKENSVEIENRGDLKRRYSDSEDFIEVPVWGIEEMLKAAYELGMKTAKEDK